MMGVSTTAVSPREVLDAPNLRCRYITVAERGLSMTYPANDVVPSTLSTEEGLLTLAWQLVSTLQAGGKTVAVAESCTGGLLAEVITRQPGASAVFEMGVVVYANRIKTQLLGVLPHTLDAYGAVSRETAQEMAIGLARHSGADYNLAITGIAGPGGGTPDKPVGTVYLALALAPPPDGTVPTRCRCDHCHFTPPHTITDARQAIRYSAAAHAIQMAFT